MSLNELNIKLDHCSGLDVYFKQIVLCFPLLERLILICICNFKAISSMKEICIHFGYWLSMYADLGIVIEY